MKEENEIKVDLRYKLETEVKVKGKVNLEKILEFERPIKITDLEKYGSTYFHFAERLKERYGMDISKDEYFELCKRDFIGVKSIGDGRKTILIEFKGVTIFCLRYKNRNKGLITCFPLQEGHIKPTRI